MKLLTVAALAAALIAAACNGSTDPATNQRGEDPIALIRNHIDSPIVWTWYDGHSFTGTDTIPGNTTRCERFTAAADSAKYEMWRQDTLTTPNGWHWYSSNWFDPTARPTWTADQTDPTPGANSQPQILVRDTTGVPC